MAIAMDGRIALLVYELLFITQRVCSNELPPPQNVKVESSVLTWDGPKDHTNIMYTVQYNTTLNDWCDVSYGTQQQFNFTAAAEDFYGKSFRVRAERGNQASDWAESKLVQCAHLYTCAPIIELKVETDKVHLWMKHRDQSLKEREGGHIRFKPLYWKRSSSNNKQEPIVNSAHLVFEDLESGQEYCFQVEYMLYHKTYGKPSREICRVIPETSKERDVRIVISGVLTLVVLTLLGGCLYFIYTNYKRIKALLQPPLDIPEHIEEFFFSDFSQPDLACHGSRVNESYDFVSFVEDVAEPEDRRDLEHQNNTVSSI